MKKPKPPLCRVIKEGDGGRKCPKCGSSMKRKKWYHLHKSICINEDCKYGTDKYFLMRYREV